MAKKIARFKLQRRLGVELPGLGKHGALERKPYPPGQHGLSRRKYSEYALKLMEKQKLRCHYQVQEKQLMRFVRDAKRGAKKDWVSDLLGRLERRLDNVVFRLGFASSIRAARQLCSHGHVYVNGKRVTVGSMVLKEGDKVTLAEKAYKTAAYFYASKAPRLEIPDFLRKEDAEGKDAGTVTAVPDSEAVPFPFEPRLIAEYYSRI